MARYQKRPVVIDAIQWDGTKSGKNRITDAFPMIETLAQSGHLKKDEMYSWEIKTLEGRHVVSKGDFVIQGIKGEFYPCKPDIFELSYVLAE